MRQHVSDENRLTEISSSTAGSDIGTYAHSIGRCPVGFAHVCSHPIPQMQSVIVKQENGAQHSHTVGFDQAGDTRQNLVQGCTDKHHLQRIKDRLTRQSLRGGWRYSRRLILERCRSSDVHHKQAAYRQIQELLHKHKPEAAQSSCRPDPSCCIYLVDVPDAAHGWLFQFHELSVRQWSLFLDSK